jgi:hypothetical protein
VKLKYCALAAGLLAFEAGCPLLDIEAEVPEVCLTYPDFEVDGALASSSVDQSFMFDDLSRLQEIANHDAGIAFTRAEVRVKEGVESLAFVQEFRATVASGDPESTLPTLVLFDCQGDCDTAGSSLKVPASAAEDALAYVKSNALVLDVKFVGEIPKTKFKLDLDVCMKGHAGYTFEP